MLRKLFSFDNFDSVQDFTDIGYSSFNSPTFSTTVPTGSGRSMIGNNQGPYLTNIIDPVANTCYIGFHYRFETNPIAAQRLFAVTEGIDAGVQLTFALTVAKTIAIYRGTTNQTLLAESTETLIPGLWYHLQFKFKIHDTTGVAEVKLNGNTTVATFSGDTQQTGNAVAACIAFYGDIVVNYRDNLYLSDNTGSVNTGYLGIITVRPALVNGDVTSPLQWTTSTGSTVYTLLDELPGQHDDNDFITSSTVGHIHRCNIEDFADITSVVGVQLTTRMGKDDTGPRSVKHGVQSGATHQQKEYLLGQGLGIYQDVFETSDGSTTLFTQTTINSLQTSVEVSV